MLSVYLSGTYDQLDAVPCISSYTIVVWREPTVLRIALSMKMMNELKDFETRMQYSLL